MSALHAFENRRQHHSNRLYEWREDAGFVDKLALSLLFVTLAAVAAQLRLYLPFTPVPFTGQVLVVLLAGFVLGRFGMVSMGLYLVLGSAFGWFSGMVGMAALAGVTAGYLFGFLVAAFVIGELAQRRRTWSFAQIVVVMSLGSGIILLLGSFWLSLLLDIGLPEALLIGALPFVAVEALKVLIASSVAYGLTPRAA
jgi:biotin transport system substrate-specific component